MSNLSFENPRESLFIPALGPFYDKIAQPMAWSLLRFAVGAVLVIEGWPKIIEPLAQSGFVESIGFYPGWFWSPFLAALQFFGGMFIAVGLFTRPFALANAIMLAITLWFHMAHPYPDAFLTQAGIDALKVGSDFFTPGGAYQLSDGGVAFSALVQGKAETASLFWTGAAFFYAAFGGGILSVDRMFMKKQF